MNEAILQQNAVFRKRAVKIDKEFLEIVDEEWDTCINDGYWKTVKSIFVSFADIEQIYDEFIKNANT